MEDSCQICGGQKVYVGTLGNVDHSKCRHCGMAYAQKCDPEEGNDDEEELDEDELSGYAEGGWREWGE